MWISDFSIRRPVITVVVMLGLVLFGTFSAMSLDTDEFPEISPPVVVVAIPYPGASPESVEREIVDPIEEGITSIAGIKRVTSSSMDGFAQIIAEFQFGKDVQQATQDIRDKISAIRRDLPPEMEEPILQRWDPNQFPIISLTLSSKTMTPADLTRIADPGLTGEIKSVSGVAQVNISGKVNRELVVELIPQAMQSAGVSVGQVMAALQSQNLAAPVGRVGEGLAERTIRLRGRLDGPADFARIAVTSHNGTLVRLGEVARVSDATEEARTVALYNGNPAVGLDILKTTNASTTAVSDRVRAKIEEVRKTLPAGVELNVIRDAGIRVAGSVKDVQHTLIEGALLTVLVVFLFLNSWRSTVITGLALPVSVLASFIMVKAFGFTLNTMSLLGLSLAVGILIDDAIVVRENIVRHMHMGKDHFTAAREGTAEIGMAVAATTLSIVVVFVPIGFINGVAGQWFKPMALTIATSVLVSLFVSFSLDPMLSAYWPDPDMPIEQRSWIARKLHGFNLWFEKQVKNYKRVIGWALNHRAAMVFIALATFVLALAMPAVGLIGSSFFPDQDIGEFDIVIKTPPGSSMEYTRLKAEEVAAMARRMEGVKLTYTTVGGQTGAVDNGNIYVKLTPKEERSVRQDKIANALRDKVAHMSGVEAQLGSGGFGPQQQIQLQLKGPDAVILTRLANEIAAEVKKVPGAADVGLSTKGEKPELEVKVDRDLASTLGLSAGSIAQALRPAFAGVDVGDWVDPSGETRDVTVRLIPEARTKASDLAGLPIVVAGADGAPVTLPLGQVASVNLGTGPAQIDHLDRHRVITVGANTRGRPLSAVVKDIMVRVDKIPKPAGYFVTQGGETESQAEVFGQIFGSLAIAIILMYMILVVQFGSFLDPIPIMASLPLSLIGVMLALLVTGTTLNLMSLIGVILLMGIVAKNAILLIDFAIWSEEKGMDRHEALIEAGGVRLRPIMMTTFAIVAGMFPTALGFGEGAEFRAPLGRAVIGGVITSTFLTLLVIPTFYDILAGWRESFFKRVLHHKAPHTPGGGLHTPTLEPAGD
jgi:HAE1 family hydrophobic/amphiphilic exporter-1